MLCLPKGHIFVEKRRSDSRPLLVRYRDPHVDARGSDRAKLVFEGPVEHVKSLFRSTADSKRNAIQVKAQASARSSCDICGLPFQFEERIETVHRRKLHRVCDGCGPAIDPAKQSEMARPEERIEPAGPVPRRRSYDEGLSMMRDLLSHLSNLFGKEERQDRDLERYKQNTMANIRKLPGEIPPLVGYPVDDGRLQVDGAQQLPALAPPNTPAVWQYPYGTRVPDSAIPGGRVNRKQYRHNIAEHNAHLLRDSSRRRKHLRHRPRRRSDVWSDSETEYFSTDETLADEVARDRAAEAIRRTSKLHKRMRDIEKDIAEKNRTWKDRMDKLRATEERIKQSPELATSGLRIHIDNDRRELAAIGEDLRNTKDTLEYYARKQQEMNKAFGEFDAKLKQKADRSIADHLDKLGLSYGEMESRLDKNIVRQEAKTGQLGNQITRLKDDIGSIRHKLRNQEEFERLNKLNRPQSTYVDPRSPFNNGRRDWEYS